MKLEETQRNWDALGRDDPLWAVLTDAQARGGRWDAQHFFATGRAEIAELLQTLEGFGVSPPRGRALDFGCGAGRLTQALAEHFETAIGVDIAPSMVACAERLRPSAARCEFRVNQDETLAQFPDGSFDLVYSARVLQHMAPRFAEGYIAEFVRVLSPHGVAVFQVPSQLARTPAGLAMRVLPQPVVRRARQAWQRTRLVMEMHAVPRTRVVELVERSGGQVLQVLPDRKAGPRWRSFTYVVAPRHVRA